MGAFERVAGEFGDQNSASVEVQAEGEESTGGGALRMYPRWSATTLAIGLREVQFALLTADTGPRPPAAPGQAHLWVLALWDAYNRVPSPANGVMDKPVGYCVSQMVSEILSIEGTPIPGMPVLHDITVVASGEKSLVVPKNLRLSMARRVFQRRRSSA